MTVRSTVAAKRRLAAGRAWWDRSLYGDGFRRMRELDLDTHALALCAQQVLCTAPLVVAMSAVVQRFDHHAGLGRVLAKFFGLDRAAATDVSRLLDPVRGAISASALVLSLVTAVVFSTSVGAVQQRAFELIWTLPRSSGVRCYLRQLVWTLTLAAYTAGMVVVTKAGRSLGGPIGANVLVSNLFEGVLTAAFYWWTQWWLLGGRVRSRALLPGALAVGVATVILVRASRALVTGQITWQVEAYGLIGVVFVLSVWLMVLSAIIFGGVLLGAVLTQRRAARLVADSDGAVGAELLLTDAGLADVSESQPTATSGSAAPSAPSSQDRSLS